jgi:N-methylhydantoinase A/oxoprolinase/acetone carboxylase beta subunit
VQGDSVVLGPKSMGAVPGPACYSLGGESATLTDALLVLGYLDPAKFFGGRRALDADLARAAIKEHVAVPLGVSVEVAALSMRDEAIEIMVELIGNLLQEVGVPADESALFAFGGNGPIFGTFVAQRLGLSGAYIFDLGPVFSTFGSAVSDVVHRYERGVEGRWDTAFVERLAPVVEDMVTQAERDLRGEGFSANPASFTWEVDFGENEEAVSTVQVAATAAPRDVLRRLDDAVRAAGQDRASTLVIRLSTGFSLGDHSVSRRTDRVEPAHAAARPVRLDGRAAGTTPVLVWEALNPGDVVRGPAMINGDTLTCPVPPGWNALVDDYGNACLTRAR